MPTSKIENHFLEAEKILREFILSGNIQKIEIAGKLMVDSLKTGGKIISCGNGGSMSDAIHFAEELTGRYRENRKAIPALAISDPGYLSCVSNDYGYSYVFSRFVEGVGNKSDVLLAISTSGNSENVINGILAAKEKGMTVIGLTGKDGGKIAQLCDVEIRAPFSEYADRAQEIHIKVIHSLIDFIEINYLN
jgi:D-sedoheptulose 7-phosphate isomerase